MPIANVFTRIRANVSANHKKRANDQNVVRNNNPYRANVRGKPHASADLLSVLIDYVCTTHHNGDIISTNITKMLYSSRENF